MLQKPMLEHGSGCPLLWPGIVWILTHVDSLVSTLSFSFFVCKLDIIMPVGTSGVKSC